MLGVSYMENNYKEIFCMACFGIQKQIYAGKFIVGNTTYDKFICCMCGHENKIEVKKNKNNV